MTQYVNQFEIGKEKGQLDARPNVNTIACRCSEAMLAGQAVKLVDVAYGIPSIAVAADTDLVFGYIVKNLRADTFVSGNMVDVAMDGTVMYMIAGTTFAPMTELMHVAATGKVITASGTTKAISAWALDKAAATDDLVRCYVTTPNHKRPSA